MHRHLVLAVAENVYRIFSEDQYADKVIEGALKSHKKWGAKDRKFVAESTYEMVRWWRLLWFCLGQDPLMTEPRLIELFGVYWSLLKGDLPDWPDFKNIKEEKVKERFEKAKLSRKVFESIPDWLDELGESELGESELGTGWTDTLHALNQKASVILRANTLKTSVQDLKKALMLEEIETDFLDKVTDGLILPERKNVFRTKAFLSGMFEVQDGASQSVAPMLQVKPGEKVIDACAGAGGKSLHLAALMKNKGKIISLDVEEWKLKELRKRSSRAGADIIETRVIDSNKVIKRLDGFADALLLDVPCSGLGVLRRNPDTKWKLSLEEIERVRGIQREIIFNYSRMVKAGGRMVYATCSILPSENQKQVELFLAEQGSGWELKEMRTHLPQKDGFDGFFAALLVRK